MRERQERTKRVDVRVNIDWVGALHYWKTIAHSLDSFLVLHLAHIFSPPLNFPVELPFHF